MTDSIPLPSAKECAAFALGAAPRTSNPAVSKASRMAHAAEDFPAPAWPWMSLNTATRGGYILDRLDLLFVEAEGLGRLKGAERVRQNLLIDCMILVMLRAPRVVRRSAFQAQKSRSSCRFRAPCRAR